MLVGSCESVQKISIDKVKKSCQKVFTCLYCGAMYSADRSLKRHCRLLQEHRPTSSTNVGSKIQNADVVVNEFINVGERYKVPRLWNLAQCVTKEDALRHL